MKSTVIPIARALVLFGIALDFASLAEADDSPSRPNVVLIIADDLGADDCIPFGNGRVRTPNLSRLAREGMRFDRAFLTCSSCSPSRSSIITGRYPHATGARQLHWPLPKDQITFVEKLKAAGYWTAQAGKWHLGNEVKDRFDVVHEASTAAFRLPTGAQTKPNPNLKNERDPSGCAGWLPTLRERPCDKPFFLWLAAFDPHRDYEPNAITPPHRPDDVVVPPYLPDTPSVRADLALYYDEIARLDGYVGRVLEELAEQKIADNTLVLFLSDNGRPFPRCKTTVYDSGIKTPLIVRWPSRIKPGSVCKSLVSSVDIAPTLLDVAGLKSEPTFQGVSFAKLFSDPRTTVRSFVHAEHNWHDVDAHERAVRDDRFKFIWNAYPDLTGSPPADAVRSPTFRELRRLRDADQLTPPQRHCFVQPRPAGELYDTVADPHELNNLAANPNFAAELTRLREELRRWQRDTGDQVPAERTPDEFDRETGQPLPKRAAQRLPKSPDRSF